MAMRALRRKLRGEPTQLLVDDTPDNLIEENRALLLKTAVLAQRCERAEREVTAVRREAEEVRHQNVALEAQLAEAIDRIAELEIHHRNVLLRNHLQPAQHAPEQTPQRNQQQDRPPPETQRCCITLEPFKPGDEVFRLPCMHVHRTEYLLPYLKRQSEPECPICRTPVPVADIDNLPVWNWYPPSSSSNA